VTVIISRLIGFDAGLLEEQRHSAEMGEHYSTACSSCPCQIRDRPVANCCHPRARYLPYKASSETRTVDHKKMSNQ
jgi:hypothetical protein